MRVAAALLITLGLAACDVFGPDDTPRAELEHAREQWQETFNPQAYTIRQSISCFCGHPSAPQLVSVQDEIVTAVRDAESGELIPEEMWQFYRPIDELFDLVEQAIEADADHLAVEYHTLLGYPTVIQVDFRTNTADDEVTVRSELLVTLLR